MKLLDIRDIFRKELELLFVRGEIDSFFYQLTEHHLGIDRLVLVMDPSYSVSPKEEKPLFEALSLLKKEYPIQYILGKAVFMDLEILVSEHVLIPRPETEELVRWIIEENSGSQVCPRILDIGTGSGCIAIALAKNLPNAEVYGLDISAKALAIAGQNAQRNGVNITFIEADIMEHIPRGRNWDIIVSNPPYVRESEKEAIRNNVKHFEPAGALFVPDAFPLLFYERIADLAIDQLRASGKVYFEISQYLAMETRELLEKRNFSEITLRKDMFGKDRMLRATVPPLTAGSGINSKCNP
jgi:release factor glutamine methyltransferase